MTFPPPEELNPFEAPRAEIGDRAIDLGDDAELVRRHHLGHERSIRSIALLCYLAATMSGLGAGVSAFFVVETLASSRIGDTATAQAQLFIFLIASLVYGTICGVSAALGFGLRRLHVWARWTAMVLSMLALLYFLLVVAVLMGGILPVPNPGAVAAFLLLFASILGYVFYLLVTPKAGVIFSREYREVIAKTPEIRTQTSRLVKISAGLLVGLVLLFTIVGLAMRGK